MTPRSRFSRPALAAFEAMMAPWRRRRLGGVHVAMLGDVALDETTALLFVANHVSWWDGFLVRDVQRRLRRDAVLLTVMDESQLRRVPFFRWLGVVGIERGSIASLRGVLATIREWRARHGARLAVSFFPQGRIWPSRRRPLGFERGVTHAARAMSPVSIVPVALHLEPMTTPSPHAFVLVGPALPGDTALPEIEQAVTGALDLLLAHLDAHGEAAVEHWPPTERQSAPVSPSIRR